MKSPLFVRAIFSSIALLHCLASAAADELHIAVASNFSETIKVIASQFEQKTGHTVILAFGSTGKHYAQIINGAPFDLFFAADSARPGLLEKTGVALPGSRFTYALGRILLWSPNEDVVDRDGRVLEQGNFRHLAIANPKLAPYGKAAQQVLEARDLWDTLGNRLVKGENIGQAFQFVKSGNAELGFVAFSQVKQRGQPLPGSHWEVPQAIYSPIEQQAVLLRDSGPARSFLSFVRSDAIRVLIRDYGYYTP